MPSRLPAPNQPSSAVAEFRPLPFQLPATGIWQAWCYGSRSSQIRSNEIVTSRADRMKSVPGNCSAFLSAAHWLLQVGQRSRRALRRCAAGNRAFTPSIVPTDR